MPATPVVFIHGLWIHSAAWAPWLELFAERGYQPSAPGWPGDADTVAETRAAADALDDVGIEQICHHYADYIDTLDAKPIVIGHSFGGLIAQELLANDLATAAIAIDPAPIKGVKTLPFCAAAFRIPGARQPGQQEADGRPDGEAIPLQLRKRDQRIRVGRAVRRVDHPRPGPTAVRGRDRELLAQFAGEG